MAYHSRRCLTLLEGVVQLTLVVRSCRTPACVRFQRPYRPEEESALALPHGEVGLDVIALAGRLRLGEHRSVPEIHRELGQRGVVLAERTVGYLIERYEELLALDVREDGPLRERLLREGGVVLALSCPLSRPNDGDGHEALWLLRDCLTGETLLARMLPNATGPDCAEFASEIQAALPVPILGFVSEGCPVVGPS